jgi:hypothetical protein
MKQIRSLLLAVVIPGVLVGTTVGGALGAPAFAAAGARPLNLTASDLQFSSFTCLNDSCSLASVKVDAKSTSNLSTGTGSFHSDGILDFSPGGTCNILDETDAFAFDKGTIFVHSHHEDCATHGLRVDTTFEVTGGAGAFEGASGGGREFASANASTVIFEGTISY